ncbi:solute carrier family 12 member 8-like isoform X2 [Amphiura filiformis]|uniref:solute carrier family 12 member 8-like isoform X2 n=1 Tax=Amphiura filiformis TaxID=82378 RepID=UPI003B210120
MADYNYQDLDAERSGLVGAPKGGGKNIEWGKFGLSEDTNANTASSVGGLGGVDGNADSYQQGVGGEKIQDLFDEQQQGLASSNKPWWKANFFLTEPVLFGTWDGVFTSCLINIFGVVIFLRTGWMVGNAGIGLSILIVVITVILALVAILSAIGVCERCHIESGGVYFLLSQILGAKIGGAVGILYVFGQAVACALYCTGFGESVAELLHWENTWAVRGVGIGVIMLLLAVIIAGVKWVIKMQLLLLAILGVATLDFLVGTFAHTDEENGFVGFGTDAFRNNTGADYIPGETFFSVFGVFFPTATGVMAGINMSGDLKKPRESIPKGTLSAMGVCTLLYFLFVLLLGATCTRDKLQEDYMIAEKVSLVGVLWLMGLYISSLSSCLGGLYGAPRILQCIANENVIPFMAVLGHGKGPNKEPVMASLVVTFVAILFIFIGHVNQLGPIVTMPFLLTYAAIDYAYFALAMSYSKNKETKEKTKDSLLSHVLDKNMADGKASPYQYGQPGVGVPPPPSKRDSLSEFKEDLDIAEEMYPRNEETGGYQGYQGGDAFGHDDNRIHEEKKGSGPVGYSDKEQLLADGEEKQDVGRPFSTEIDKMPESWYSRMCNRWVSFVGMICSLIIMFCIQWGYALAVISVYLIVFVYITKTNPGVRPGIVDFSLLAWLQSIFNRICRRGPPPQEHMIVNSSNFQPNITTEQLTEDNEDFAQRAPYHQAMVNESRGMGDYEYNQ